MMLERGNLLIRQDSGIYLRDGHQSISYSDGGESEKYLRGVLSSAGDLSSISPELELKIKDWPSEYHLSNKRANLMRALNTRRGLRVLELGSGCGAISRYLGEQGHDVDAIEGSKIRAELGALRCRDLENVRILCANFNDLTLPDNYYDLVVLVGVIEYAGRFRPGSDGDPAVELLRTFKRSLRDDGMIIVAIENRTGLKYVLGAHEDHYGRRYVGTHGYRNDLGIRTYTTGEWETIIGLSGFGASRFLLPFPDYKVPTVILSAEYAAQNRFAFSHLEGLSSRDYTMPLRLGLHEPMFWQASCANGTLGAFANSFLIMIGDRTAALEEAAPFDFAHLPDFKRKRAYSVITTKPRQSELVTRERVDEAGGQPSPALVQSLLTENFIAGNLLSVEWSRSLAINPWGGQFKELLIEYYGFLSRQTLSIDLVPNNIIVCEDASYEFFDQEWKVPYALNRDYIFFRAQLLFAIRYIRVIGEFARRHGIHTVRDFVLFSFRAVGIDASERMEEFCRMENDFQIEVNEHEAEDTAQTLLAARMNEPAPESPVCAKLYWRQSGQGYSEENCIAVDAAAGPDPTPLNFVLPEGLTDVSHVRFDPCDEWSGDDVGFLTIPYLRISASIGGRRLDLVELAGCESIATTGRLSGMVYNKARYGEVFAVVGDNPELEVAVNRSSTPDSLTAYNVTVECSHIRSKEYRLVRDGYLAREGALHKQLESSQNELIDLKRVNDRLANELREIKTSKLWKVGERYRSLMGKGRH